MRLFVAVELSDEIKSALIESMEVMRAQGVRGNFTRRENLHITLAFIGETDRIQSAKKCLDVIEMPSFTITLGNTGNFRSIFWVGPEASAELSVLARRVRESLRAAGFDIDNKPFRPHITLVREFSCDPKPPFDFLQKDMKVGEIVLMASDRINGRLTYTPIARKSLIVN